MFETKCIIVKENNTLHAQYKEWYSTKWKYVLDEKGNKLEYTDEIDMLFQLFVRGYNPDSDVVVRS